MNKITLSPELLAQFCGVKVSDNLTSVFNGLVWAKGSSGLVLPPVLAVYLAQLSHESLGFKHDREIWGPTPAQERYDTRTDLGNTPQRDGDGYMFRGRTGFQITGKANTTEFREWCRLHFGDDVTPDFVVDPDAMNTDPWEGLGPIWYWETRALDSLALAGQFDLVTKRINGGYNGAADRRLRYVGIALLMLGYPTKDLRAFQKTAGLVPDGIIGPKTMAAVHQALLKLPDYVLPASAPKPSAIGETLSVLWAALRSMFATN